MNPPPERLWGIYDVVHVRLLFAVIDGDPTAVVEHCLKLLKPGGYLQWDEMDPGALHTSSHVSAPSLDALAEIWKNARSTAWISRLPQIFEQNHLSVVATDTFSEHLWQRHMMMEIWCLSADDFAARLESSGSLEKASVLRQLATDAYPEIKRGAFYSHAWRVVVGRTRTDSW